MVPCSKQPSAQLPFKPGCMSRYIITNGILDGFRIASISGWRTTRYKSSGIMDLSGTGLSY
jgi:hypothetical protein